MKIEQQFFCEEIIELFQRLNVARPKPVDYMEKRQMLLIDIGGKWFMDKHKSELYPMKYPKLSKEAHNKESVIKKILKNIINIAMIGNSISIGIN